MIVLTVLVLKGVGRLCCSSLGSHTCPPPHPTAQAYGKDEVEAGREASGKVLQRPSVGYGEEDG